MPPAPAMPPTLNNPWKPDIMARPLARSTMIACMFIDTSMAPMLAPNTSNAATRTGAGDATASAGNIAATNSADAMITRRQPSLADKAPASGIMAIEPAPRQSSSSPRVPSLMFARAFANGTSGAQAALPKPAMKNAIRVARCSARAFPWGSTSRSAIGSRMAG